MSELLDRFGAFVVRHLRDSMFDDLEMFLRGDWKAPELQELQNHLKELDEGHKRLLRDLVEQLTTTGLHHFLFALQEEAENGGDIKVLVQGVEVAKLTDGLHGEPSGEDGWIVRFSQYRSQRQIDLSRWAEAEIRKIARKSDE
jgi:hypothetical protein